MKQPLEQAVELALKKKGILNDSVLKYLIRAALGFYRGIGLMVSFRLGEGFFDIQSPVASIMSSIFLVSHLSSLFTAVQNYSQEIRCILQWPPWNNGEGYFAKLVSMLWR